MNVAIKSGQLQKALEVYHEMLREGCTPNVVTYNTLIDVYGKTGQWQEALRVIDTMNASNTKPVTRTYNTLMIACNTSGQWQEALSVYNDMVRRGHQPNTTTYNALISAYSKAGRLEKVRKQGFSVVAGNLLYLALAPEPCSHNSSRPNTSLLPLPTCFFKSHPSLPR
jgi:pentatricopeptide repeat domain-containing protein 1